MSWHSPKPVRAGIIGAAVTAALLAIAVLAPSLYFSSATGEFHAKLANAAGLKQDDPVYVAGVPSGRVTGIGLDGDRVDVKFRLDHGVKLGDATSASVKLMTVLGRRYLGVEPAGAGELRDGGTIPLERTSVPYELDDLGRQAQKTGQQLDLPRLRTLMRTMSDVLPKDPGQLGKALDGVSAVTSMVADNDDQLGKLLSGAQQVTDTLLSQKDTLVSLLGNADLVLHTLTDRRAAISQLISDVADLTTAANDLLHRHGRELDGLLDHLHSATGALTATEQNLGRAIEKLAPTSRYLANATGNGTWADVAGPAGPIPDNLLCVVGLAGGCK
ncbi:MCE family protein [Amycolatopsis sp. CA-230715]|uniref:MCE family protein n=1 Tax=Amycolatopsis sp. CA-230715 TaxID=2745196 RepID=UPI001C01AE3B|nr:MCE family protein [Amycolatopsis sp. CA-230715]QWF82664.1 hypothetical protein HUW46_06103 [Amycolatopsis sp. CA-230715]